MTRKPRYTIHRDIKFDPLEHIDLPTFINGVSDPWFNQTLCEVNDCVVRVGVFQKGEFHWHKHDNEDEFFFVLDGIFEIDLEDRTVTLKEHQGFTVPRGVMHRTRVPDHATVLMVEGKSVKPTGD